MTNPNDTEYSLQKQIRRLAFLGNRFKIDFPGSVSTHNLAAANENIGSVLEQLYTIWNEVNEGSNFVDEKKIACARNMTVEINSYLTTRIHGKYYLPLWRDVYELKYKIDRALSTLCNKSSPHFDHLALVCYEIGSAAGYGLAKQNSSVTQKSDIIEVLKNSLWDELKKGVYAGQLSLVHTEPQVVLLLKVLVTCAEAGLMSEEDRSTVRDFIGVLLEGQPVSAGIDLSKSPDTVAVIARQNELLRAALPFFT